MWRLLRYVKSQRTHLENMFVHVHPNFQLTHSCYFCFPGVLQHHLVDSGVSTALSKLSSEENVTSISDQITRLISMLDSGWTAWSLYHIQLFAPLLIWLFNLLWSHYINVSNISSFESCLFMMSCLYGTVLKQFSVFLNLGILFLN